MNNAPATCQLYLVSPPKLDVQAFRHQLQSALEAGKNGLIGAFQLRLKEADDAQILEATRELLPLCKEYGVAFILNDRVDLAAQCRTDGVHLGQEDLAATSIESARNALGEEAAIGITCHASRHLAMEAGEAGADYVAFGAFYPTTSKPIEKLEKWGTPTPEILEWWSRDTVLPCVAIGGITPANAAPLVAAGADFLGVITAVWNHPKGSDEAVKEFDALIKNLANITS